LEAPSLHPYGAGGCASERWSLLKRAAWTVLVVMVDVDAHDLFEVAAAEDQKAVEAFA
jgi:hypothetical protein